MKLIFEVNKPPEFVFDYLTDMQKFASVHPIISRIDPSGDDSFLVHETLKIGFIPFSFTYPVKIKSDAANKTVAISATVMKFTRIEMDFVVKTKYGFSVVEETIRFKSPLPVKFVMRNIFKKQHTQLFKNIESVEQ